MVSVIEEGISKYGIGTSRQVCVLLDRSTYLRAGVKKKEDMSVIPNLVKLFQHLYSTIIVSENEMYNMKKSPRFVHFIVLLLFSIQTFLLRVHCEHMSAQITPLKSFQIHRI